MAPETRRLTIANVESRVCLCGGQVRQTTGTQPIFGGRLLRFACFICARDIYIDPAAVEVPVG